MPHPLTKLEHTGPCQFLQGPQGCFPHFMMNIRALTKGLCQHLEVQSPQLIPHGKPLLFSRGESAGWPQVVWRHQRRGLPQALRDQQQVFGLISWDPLAVLRKEKEKATECFAFHVHLKRNMITKSKCRAKWQSQLVKAAHLLWPSWALTRITRPHLRLHLLLESATNSFLSKLKKAKRQSGPRKKKK